jgi:hypothetical protein
VGFYGGINYGYGYFGNGYRGGHWVGNSFAYNVTVNHLSPGVIHNTYAETVASSAGRSSISYNGGPGGAPAQHANIGPKPAVAKASVQATRAPAETDSQDQPSSRTSAPKSTSVPAPRVARPKAPAKP